MHRNNGLDGIVLEHSVPHLMEMFTRQLKQLFQSKLVVLVVPPVKFMHTSYFNSDSLAKMLDCCVDYISLMTYDYSSPSIPGANSPLEWLEEALVHLIQDKNQHLANRILMGINFY